MMMLRHLGAILRILGHQNGAFFPLVGSLQEDRCDAVRWEEFYSNVLLLALLHSELVLPWFQMMHCSKFSRHQRYQCFESWCLVFKDLRIKKIQVIFQRYLKRYYLMILSRCYYLVSVYLPHMSSCIFQSWTWLSE